MSLSAALHFAPNTPEETQKIIVGLFPPEVLLGAYRHACGVFKTRDLVISASQQNPDGIKATPRVDYIRDLAANLGQHAKAISAFTLSRISAHKLMKLPADEEAFWIIVDRGGKDAPLNAVLHSMPYEQVPAGATLIGES